MTQKYQVKVSMKQAAIVETGIVLKQGDFGMQIEIEVLDFDATGTTPQIVFRKAMGAVESTTITVSSNKYTYTFKGTELDTPGKVFCDLKLKNSTTQRISTASFMFKVVADTLDGLAEESSSYSDTIAQIVGSFDGEISDLQNVTQREVEGVNLMGNEAGVLYPVYIKPGTTLTISSSDGQVFGDGGTKMQCLDINKNQIREWTLLSDVSSRTVTTSSTNPIFYYLRWSNTPRCPMMVAISDTALTYVPYYPPIREYAQAIDEDLSNTKTEMRKGFDEIENNILDNERESCLNDSWERKTIAGGAIYDNANNWLMMTPYNPNGYRVLNIQLPEGVQCVVAAYTSASETQAISVTTVSDSGLFTTIPSRVYRFLLKKSDSSTVTATERDQLVITTETNKQAVISAAKGSAYSENLKRSIYENINEIKYFERGRLQETGKLYVVKYAFYTPNRIFISKGTQINITLPSGVHAQIYKYISYTTLDGTAIETLEASGSVILADNGYYCFVVFNSDQSDMYPSVLNSVSIWFYQNTDRAFTFFEENGEKEILLDWKRGTYAGNGTFYPSTTNFVNNTPIYYTQKRIVKLIAPEGISASFWRFGSLDSSAEVATTIQRGTTINLVNNKYYFIVLKRSDNGIITDSDLKDCHISYVPNTWAADVQINAGTYATEYHAEEDSVVNSIYSNVTDDCIVFGLITDNHCGQDSNVYPNIYNHARIIDKLTERALGDFTINLGDTFMHTDDHAENARRFNAYWKNHCYSRIPALYCQGNHEVFVLQDESTALEEWQLLGLSNNTYKWIQKSTTNKLFYYFDVRNIRCIVLASSTNTNAGFSNDQITFLTNALESLNGKKAVIFTHITPFGDLCRVATVANGPELTEIMEAHASDILACFHGHVHWDNVVKVNGITYISTACAIPNKVTIPTGTYFENATAPDRAYGMYSEFLMDLVVVDAKNETIKTFRFGAGSNRVIDVSQE